jgi:thiamine pyrophosphate-dependent acetolactate synthase large subunit-like protein
MTVGNFLLRRLKEAGIGHMFGVPGDFNLELLQQMEDGGYLKWVGTCNEMNASYAADGYARLNGMGAVAVTNAVGALGAINGIAGSYAEHVPVILIAGSIALRSIERGLGMHHTMGDGTWDRFLGAMAHVTGGQARLTPYNAAAEIDRLILTAAREKLPVYMELPSDISYLDIEVPAAPLVISEPASDPERLKSCAAAIAGQLSHAKSTAILVDRDVDQYGVATEVMGLAEKLQMPVAVTGPAKAVIDETFAYYAGVYNGRASAPQTRKAIEKSDCLLSIGYRPIDGTSGDYTAKLPADTIRARGHSVDVGEDNYQAVTLKEVLGAVTDAVPQVTGRANRHFTAAMPSGSHADGSAKLTQAVDLWPRSRRPAVGTITHRRAWSDLRAPLGDPRDVWMRFFESAEQEISVLAYSALFLAEDAGLLGVIEHKALNGVRVRLALGDPDSQSVALRGQEEGIGDAMAAKVRNALTLYWPLMKSENVEIRLHRTVLYNSIFRSDDQLLVNQHAYRMPAAHAPVFCFRNSSSEDMAATYLASFEKVWAEAMRHVEAD